MNFAGMIKTSMVDYPKKIATTLFNCGCNFNCSYCHNHDLIEYSEEKCIISEEEVFKHLDKRKKLIDAVVISGGEPLIWNKNLDEFLKKIKQRYDNNFLIKLDTNGSFPKRLEEIVDYLDFVAVDFKSLDYLKFSNVKTDKIKQSIDILEKNRLNYEVRITMYPDYIKENDFESIAKELENVKKVVIQQYRKMNKEMIEPYNNSVLERFKEVISRRGIKAEIR